MRNYIYIYIRLVDPQTVFVDGREPIHRSRLSFLTPPRLRHARLLQEADESHTRAWRRRRRAYSDQSRTLTRVCFLRVCVQYGQIIVSLNGVRIYCGCNGGASNITAATTTTTTTTIMRALFRVVDKTL